MNTFTGQPLTVKAILNRYEPHLRGCRDLIIADLNKTPGTAVLIGYFKGRKMFRALLTFVAASAFGIEPSKMIPVASALEILHGASLIHDDIVDEAAERRSRPALHVQMGIGPALILGDYLILRSFTVLQELRHLYRSKKVLEASHTLNYYAQLCCLGELHELMPIGKGNPEDEYLTIVRGKLRRSSPPPSRCQPSWEGEPRRKSKPYGRMASMWGSRFRSRMMCGT